MNEMQLYQWRYQTKLVGGPKDIWHLTGFVVGNDKFVDGEEISLSRPVHFNEETMVVTTKSGSKYKLIECQGNVKDQISYIFEDIEKHNQKESILNEK